QLHDVSIHRLYVLVHDPSNGNSTNDFNVPMNALSILFFPYPAITEKKDRRKKKCLDRDKMPSIGADRGGIDKRGRVQGTCIACSSSGTNTLWTDCTTG